MTKRVNNNLIRTKRIGWLWLAGSFFFLLNSQVWAQVASDGPVLNRCGSYEYEHLLQQRNPKRLQQFNELNRLIQQRQAEGQFLRQQADTTIYRIPVVVHVVHHTASGVIGGANNSNISDEQIISQIDVLNEDYRRKSGTNGFNTSPIGADAGIEFYLATTDPDGKPTNGITRHYYTQKTSFDIFDSALPQIAYWSSSKYLNIWVTTLQSNYLGYTPFPTAADTLQGLPPDSDEFFDGSVIDYRVFGRQPATAYSSLYLLGRTVSHEIGHWLGLYHPDGSLFGSADCGDDFVGDTPPTDNLNQTNSCNDIFSTCSGTRTRELVENYMMYSPDKCMNMFTVGQVARMRTVLATSPRRVLLIKSATGPLPETEKLTINLYPNPTISDPFIDVQLKGSQSFRVDLLDLTGRQLRTSSYSNSPSTRVSVSVSGLSSGMYIVRVKTDNEIVSKRLLVH